MKNLIALIILLIITSRFSSQVDPHWNTDGNSGTDPTSEFLGTGDNVGLAIRTNDHIRMLFREGTTFDEDGEIAIGASLSGTADPLDRVHLMEDEQGRIYIRFTQGDLGNDEDEKGLQVGLS